MGFFFLLIFMINKSLSNFPSGYHMRGRAVSAKHGSGPVLASITSVSSSRRASLSGYHLNDLFPLLNSSSRTSVLLVSISNPHKLHRLGLHLCSLVPAGRFVLSKFQHIVSTQLLMSLKSV